MPEYQVFSERKFDRYLHDFSRQHAQMLFRNRWSHLLKTQSRPRGGLVHLERLLPHLHFRLGKRPLLKLAVHHTKEHSRSPRVPSQQHQETGAGCTFDQCCARCVLEIVLWNGLPESSCLLSNKRSWALHWRNSEGNSLCGRCALRHFQIGLCQTCRYW